MADIPVRHMCNFTQQLATLVSAGVPLLQSLSTVAKGVEFKPLQETVVKLQHKIAQGQSLHQSMRETEIFDHFFCQLVAAGELCGNLDGMLRRISTHLERQHRLQQKLKMASIYPLAVLFIALLVVIVILIWVVPVFQGIFASFGAELPAATRLVLNLSDAVLNQGPAYAFIVLMICMLLKSMFRRHASWQLLAAVWGLKIPLVGALIKMSNTAVWTRCMSTLLESGVPLLDALEVSAGTCRNRVFAISTWAIRHMVSQGGSLSHAMQHAHALIPQTRQTHSVFDELLTQLVSVGEETGHLGTLLTQAANEQEQALERQIDSMTQLIEPVMVVVLGGIVGGLVVALYLPVFQLGQVL